MSLCDYLSVCVFSLGKKLTRQEDQKFFKTLFGLIKNSDADNWLGLANLAYNMISVNGTSYHIWVIKWKQLALLQKINIL